MTALHKSQGCCCHTMHGLGALSARLLGWDLYVSSAGGCCKCCQDDNNALSALTHQSAGQCSKKRVLRPISADAVLFQTVLKHEIHHISRCGCVKELQFRPIRAPSETCDHLDMTSKKDKVCLIGHVCSNSRFQEVATSVCDDIVCMIVIILISTQNLLHCFLGVYRVTFVF